MIAATWVSSRPLMSLLGLRRGQDVELPSLARGVRPMTGSVADVARAIEMEISLAMLAVGVAA